MASVSSDDKLRKLAEIEGFVDPMDLIEESVTDAVCPGICMNPDCEYTTEVEPDCSGGFCEACGTASVRSALMLGGVI